MLHPTFGSGLPLSFSGIWSESMHKVHIAIQELQAVVLMLFRMDYDYLLRWLPYIWIIVPQKLIYVTMVSLSLLGLACQILNQANKNDTIIPVYIPMHLNAEADYLSWGRLVLEWHLLPHIAWAAFKQWRQLGVHLLASLCTNQCQHCHILENPLPLEALELNTFNHPFDISDELYGSSTCISSPSSVSCRIFHSSVQTSYSRGTLLGGGSPVWLPTVPSMMKGIFQQCPIIKYHHGCFSRPGPQGSAITAFNLLPTQICVLHRQGFSSSVFQAVAGAT